jgi:hypothetical protein
MKDIAAPSPMANSNMDNPSDREIMLSTLRVAAARAKYEANLFESVGILVRQKALTCAEAVERLKREGVARRIEVRQ